MSRIGRMPIVVPAGVEVKINGSDIEVKGPKGTLTRTVHSDMALSMEGNEIHVTRPSDDKEHRSLHGLTRSLVANMVEGVSNGYKKELEINGIGYRAEKNGKTLVLTIGSVSYTHLRAHET